MGIKLSELGGNKGINNHLSPEHNGPEFSTVFQLQQDRFQPK